MKKPLPTVFWLIAALPLLLFEALLYLPPILWQLLDKWRYTALTLQEPPPPEGMFGAMARRLNEKQSTKR